MPKLQVQGIPTFVILDQDGAVITTDARGEAPFAAGLREPAGQEPIPNLGSRFVVLLPSKTCDIAALSSIEK